jgi:DNA-binding transcriptional LysR family regulator
MDKLKAFESFVSVATKGSLTAAAKAEGVAPAIMGRRLDALEEHLGVKLLVRTTRRISLTHEGSAFLEDCQRLLADVANAEASVSAGGVKATGHLRITAPAGFGRRHVAPLVPRFRDLHPDVTISLNLSDRVATCPTPRWSACAWPTTGACASPPRSTWNAGARPCTRAS